MFKKHHTKESKRKISKANKNRKHTKIALYNIKKGNKNKNQGKNNPNYGRYKENSANWKGSNGLPLFNTYAHQINWCEEVRRNNEDKNILEVKCTYCGKWYIPNYNSVSNRLQVLKNNKKYTGECRFYCSNSCKQECSIFNQKIWPKGFKIATSREVQPELRQMVFKRDGYKCVKCGSTENLHCHHVEGIRWEPIESADIDKCMTTCKNCHIEIHKQEDCGYQDLQCINT